MSQVVSGVEEGNWVEECNLQGLGVFLFVNNILVFMSWQSSGRKQTPTHQINETMSESGKWSKGK